MSSVHSQRICLKCFGRLRRYQQQKRNQRSASLFGSLFVFKPHESNCDICYLDELPQNTNAPSTCIVINHIVLKRNCVFDYLFKLHQH